jgi:hypothetical protein
LIDEKNPIVKAPLRNTIIMLEATNSVCAPLASALDTARSIEASPITHHPSPPRSLQEGRMHDEAFLIRGVLAYQLNSFTARLCLGVCVRAATEEWS